MNKNLIVFCPGFSGLPPKRFNPLLRRLESDFDVVSMGYESFGRGDITDTAKTILHVVKPLRELYAHITFLGHSMGGLVARKVLSLDPTVGDSLVTIGTPHKGTQAAIWPFWSIAQMKPYSKFLTYLGKPEVPTLTLTGAWDFLVPDGSMPGIKNIVIPKGEHSLMLASSRVYGEIYCWLKYELLE